MGDNSAYQFPVALEWDLGAEKLKELKNKLLVYFQSRNKSDGGECVIKDPDCTQGYILIHFSQETVRNRVLGKRTHELPLSNGKRLKFDVKLPDVTIVALPPVAAQLMPTGPDPEVPGPSYEMNNVLHAPQLHRALIKNVSDSCTQEMLNLLVETVSAKCQGQDFYIEMIPEIGSAVVTFTCNIDLFNVIDKFSGSLRVNQMKLTVQPMMETKSIRAENLPLKTSDIDLVIYFECPRNGGGRVQEVVLISEEEAALLTFYDEGVVQTMLGKQHAFGKKQISVYPYYVSLGITLYGEKGPCVTLPNPVKVQTSPYILEFILGHPQIREDIDEKMAAKNCEITWPDLNCSKSPIKLSIPSSLSSYLRTMAKIVRTWKNQVSTEFSLIISRFKVAKYKVIPSAWEAIKGEVSSSTYEGVLVKLDLAEKKVFLAGWLSDVNKTEQTLSKLLQNITREAERQTLEEAEPIDQALYKLLLAKGFEETVMRRYPQLNMSYDKLRKSLMICGLREEIDGVKYSVQDMKGTFKQKAVVLPSVVLNFLRQADMDGLSCLLIEHGIRAMFYIHNNTLILIGCSIKDLSEAEERLRSELQWKEVFIDHQITQSPEWTNLKVHLDQTFNTERYTLKVYDLAPTGKPSVILSGLAPSMQSAYQQIHEFVEKNSPLQKEIQVRSEVAIKYLKETETQLCLKMKNITVKIEMQQHMISLQGPRPCVQKAETLVQTMLSSLHIRKLIITKPGVKKLCKENTDMYSTVAMRKFSCVIHVQEDEEDDQDGFTTALYKDDLTCHNGDNEVNAAVKLTTKEGLNISVLQRDIQDATSDAIANSVGSALNLSRGKSCRALYSRAGPKLQELLKNVSQGALVVPGSVFITDGCKLNCQKVLHAVTPVWDNGAGSSETLLRKIVKSCLELLEQHQLKSISFPAIGTGSLGFPKDLVATVMFSEVFQFSSNNKPQSLQEVAFILHPSDTDTIKAFTREFTKHNVPGLSPVKPCASPAPAPGFYGKVTSSALGVHEMKIGPVLYQVKPGDITKETSDVIVNSSDQTFSLKLGVSRAILEAAGQSVEIECALLRAQPHKGFIVTKGGSLQCKWILHVVGPTEPMQIKACVLEALQECARLKATSVAFPAIGTGMGAVPPSDVADAMLEAVEDYVRSRPVLSLQEIKIMIFQQQMLNEFYVTMKQKEGSNPPAPQSLPGQITSPMKSPLKAKKTPKSVDFAGSVEPVIFQICGKSKDNVTQASNWLNDLILKEQSENVISWEWPEGFSIHDKNNLNDLEAKHQVVIKVEPSKLRISGLTRDVLKVSLEVQAMIEKKKDKKTKTQEAQLCLNLVEWKYRNGEKFVAFDKITNMDLEKNQDNVLQTVTVNIKGEKYKVDFQNKCVYNNLRKRICIQRTLKGALLFPDYWDEMETVLYKEVTLDPTGKEYKRIKALTSRSCAINILMITRIQNKHLWQNYQIRKQSIDAKNEKLDTEKQLFHGTQESTIKIINQHGFNRSYVGMNAASYGNGTYFAVDASYSAADTYSKPDKNGQKYMYLARVLTGLSCLGHHQMISPPSRSTSDPTDLYDSATDNITAPRMFVIFNDVQAYPEYLITFKM
ncbi:protein mono-ADP-ribosyltransferase PARP14 [Xenopus laevis]|uniref:Poly [ADP-ribose] polymerase n=2 Tax=Xenopus laevis TaxID=8355 RepID=A0A1L8EV90_XENLA|nr:protein mono-ADP-ribosyltransferase PARP14 [Xenopus laevis]XP_041432358.1 protein mono-ADP-ribosyltransferase PARP14 [Xenopus laevis]OCT63240.1 hypothetical protein XELAEV_18044338mg [Xenopus laevis]